MSLQENINKSIKLREDIKNKEIELSNILFEIETEMLSNAKFEDDLHIGSTIVAENGGKRYIVEDLNVYYAFDTLLPYISPVIRRIQADGITPGNVKDVDNYNFARTPFLEEFDNKLKGQKVGSDRFTVSNIRISSSNNYSKFFVVKKLDKKEQKIKKVAAYTNQSGYKSFTFPEDDLLELIVSHTTAPINFERMSRRHNYYLEIVTKDGRNFIYTEKSYHNKAVRLTQKKIEQIKEMILDNDERLLEYFDEELSQATIYSSNFHSFSSGNFNGANNTFYNKFKEYMVHFNLL